MVIIKFMGGLGNQMFQYAVGRSLAKQVYIDQSFFINNNKSTDTFTARDYQLNLFPNIQIKYPNYYWIRFLKSSKTSVKVLKNILSKKITTLTLVDDSTFKETIIATHNLYLYGYFQDPSYFDSIRNVLLEEFLFPELSDDSKKVKQRILNSTVSVSIHVRRGDYLKPNVQKYHGVMGLQYYKDAIKIMSEKFEKVSYFIFSDDLLWCKENFDFLTDKYLVDTASNSWEDMCLMTICNHNITANSSYSWWGAWLNQNHEKVVIAPQKWFAAESTAIIPEEWIAL